MTTPKTPFFSRILMGFLRRAFQSGTSVLYVFAGIIAILTAFNPEFALQLSIGLAYILVLIIIIVLILLSVNEKRVKAKKPPIPFNFKLVWNSITHNSLTASITIMIILVIACLLQNQIATEAGNAFVLICHKLLFPIFQFIFVIAIAIFGLMVIGKGTLGNHGKH